MNTRNNHQNLPANRATRRHGAKAKAAKPVASTLFAAMFQRHYDSLDLGEQLNLAPTSNFVFGPDDGTPADIVF